MSQPETSTRTRSTTVFLARSRPLDSPTGVYPSGWRILSTRSTPRSATRPRRPHVRPPGARLDERPHRTSAALATKQPGAKAKQPPPRILIQFPPPAVDGGRYPVKRCVGDRVDVSADIFRDGHDLLRAVVRYRPARDASGARPSCAGSTPTSTASAGPGASTSTARAAGCTRRGLDRRVRHLARRARAQARGRPAGSLRRAVRRRPDARGRRAAAPSDEADGADRARATVLDDDETPRGGQARRRARPRAVRHASSEDQPRHGSVTLPSRRCRSRSTASGPASAAGTSCSRAPGAG